MRDGTKRHVWYFRFPWDLWRGAVGTWEWEDEPGLMFLELHISVTSEEVGVAPYPV